jgi:hypothetical protein
VIAPAVGRRLLHYSYDLINILFATHSPMGAPCQRRATHST